MAHGTRLVYITAPNKDEALRIARQLVTERLAACANVIDGATSVYWWDAELVESAESVIFLKTRDDLVDALIKRAQAIHPYDCPCVVALEISAGNPDFLTWIGAETQSPAG